MHHFEEFSIVRDARDGESFDITYTNEHTGQSITLNIPQAGVFEDPERVLTDYEAGEIAQRVGHTLSHSLTENLGLEVAGTDEALSGS